MDERLCEVSGCDRPVYARTWCSRHYQLWLRTGDVIPKLTRHTGTPAERLLAKTRVSSTGCWEWQASLNPKGYGNFRLDGQMTVAHRAAYLLLVGPVPEGRELDHLCRNRACVNPAHLEAVSHLVNVRRGDKCTNPASKAMAWEGAR